MLNASQYCHYSKDKTHLYKNNRSFATVYMHQLFQPCQHLLGLTITTFSFSFPSNNGTNLFGVSAFRTHWDNLRVFNNAMQAIFLLSYGTQDFRASSDTSTIVPHVSVINHSRKKTKS
jgi:hypothetical protein